MKTRIAVTACLVSLLIGRSAWTQIAPPTYDYIKTGVLEAKIDSSSGSPQLVINGQAIPPLLFFFNNSYPDRMQFLAPQVRAANAAGIHLFSMVFYNWPWDPGDAAHPPDYSQSNSQMDQFLAIDPHAAFLLRIPAGPPPSWSGWATHAQWGKNEDILHSDGTTTIDSVASNVYLQALLSGVTNMVQHYEASAYASHILGYHITGANTGEWFPDQYREKGLDYSPANTTAFRSWLQQKYGTDAALSNAWGRSVTINTAPIPIPVAGRFPIHSAASAATTDPVPSFYRLPAEQDWVDYSAYTSDIFSSQILAIAHAVRTATKGKRLVAFFNGYIYDLPGSMNGHTRMDRLLASPDIDMIAAPISYNTLQERLGGGAGGAMSALDSVALHGKLWMNEDDLRTYLAANLPDLGYNGNLPTSDFFETSNVLQRNLAAMLVHRGGTWWMDLNANGTFNDPDLWSAVMGTYGLPLYNQLGKSAGPYRPEVAVITDQQSVLYQSSDWDLMGQARTTLRNAIAKTGASVGYYDLSDFISGALPPARAYLFANTFFLTDDQIAAIRTRLELEGATAIWQYAPGYLGPAGPDVARSSALTGIQLLESSGFCGSTGSSWLNGIFFGWLWETASIRATLTPRLVVSDPAATAVGRYLSDNAVSSAYKNKDGFTSIFLGDVGWTTDMIRPLLTAAGVHIWDPSGDVVHTDGAWLVLHAGSAGARTVSLPAGVTATPLDGQGTPATSPQPLQVSFQRMGETRWFGLTHDSPILSIALTHQGDFIQGQTGATYTVTASNAATAAATSGAVTITDTAPSGIKLVAMAGTGWTCPAGWTTCTRSDVLAAGSNYPPITATVNVAANAASPEVNRVSVTGGGAPGASAMDSTTIAATTLPCGASLSPAGQAFAATGGPGNITVTAPSGCAWSISGLPDWVTITSGSFGSGNGTVAYQATANTGTWRTASFAVGGSAFVVEQSSATLGPLTTVGTMPQVASGGGWETAIVLVNLGTAPAQARLNFFDDKGGAMPLPMSFPQAPLGGPLLGAQLEQTIAPGAEVVIETSGAGMAATAGWAQLQANGGITGYARFNWAVGGGVQEAVVPLESRTPSSFVLSYDQTGGFGTGVAVANVLNQNASVAVTVRDDTGAVLVSDNLQLAAYGHTAYMVADRYPATTQGRGTVEFKTPTGGQIATLAFRASAVGTLSTIPSMAK